MRDENTFPKPAPGGMSARGGMVAGGVVKTRAPVAPTKDTPAAADTPPSDGDNEQ